MEPYLTLFIAVLAGLVGFFSSTFWIQPILRYRDIRSKIIERLIYLSDVYEDDSTNYFKEHSENNVDVQEVLNFEKKRMKEKYFEGRKLSGELHGVILYLPNWYKSFFLKRRDENPWEAKNQLIGFANSRDYKETILRIRNIQKLLKIPGKDKLK